MHSGIAGSLHPIPLTILYCRTQGRLAEAIPGGRISYLVWPLSGHCGERRPVWPELGNWSTAKCMYSKTLSPCIEIIFIQVLARKLRWLWSSMRKTVTDPPTDRWEEVINLKEDRVNRVGLLPVDIECALAYFFSACQVLQVPWNGDTPRRVSIPRHHWKWGR